MGVIATAVKHLIAAGLSGDALVRAIEDMEDNQVTGGDEPVLTKRQERNKRHYQRLKASEKRLNKTIKTVSDGGAPSSSPIPLSSPPTPPPIIPHTPSPTPETKRATRLSTDWVLPAAWGRWALDEGCAESVIRLEADKFRDFWCSKSGKDATKVDWFATWRNWIRNSSKAPASRGPPARAPSITDVLKQQVLEMQADGRENPESDGNGKTNGAGQALLGLAYSSR
jgi:hypothetical protein